MRHLLWKPRTLVQVSAGIALVKGSSISKWKYKKLSLITWFVFGVTRLLVTGWTTLLAPTLVSCYSNVQGTELNMASPAFSQLLGVELNAYSPSAIHDASFPIIDVGGSVSGIAAAGVSFGMPGIINFNEAKYNLSTGGVLATVTTYAGSQTPAGTDGTRLNFSGGATFANAPYSGSARNWLGIQTNFSVLQQGITANITCQSAAMSSQLLNFTNLNITTPITPPGSTSPAYSVVAWNSTANCSASSLATQQYITWANASGQPDLAGTGFLPSIVCPGHLDVGDVYSKFVIATQGFYKYDFLPSTVCEVTPLITTTRVDYTDGGIINASQIISNQTFSPNETYLLFYLAGVANYHARNSQGLLNNIIGDTLYSIYSGQFSTPISNNMDEVYKELENYWRGVIEFSATFLRAGYSAEGAFQDGIPSNMTSDLDINMSMVTIGWANRGPIYIFSILPLGIVTLLTITAAVYSLVESWKERHDKEKRTSFDVSDTLHLIMASAEGGLASKLSGFNEQGLIDNEKLQVNLTELPDHRKKLDTMKDSEQDIGQ
ncbi:hypothetical protein PAXRUDRAFT_834783 [Paxillus rubicundulus Ve08.2h10]|uniref:Unplaced genomic scaffold scaffold_1945, whole genome shotgun sequence n=1 Tax=Paxillus rubicundulus Ve08.2h10 TaxID=930991 RepID=A0A0D0DBH7_9AGAM|nr:hypothetical protein PAXRUDRAFT_834783 [Paxillus rubicundulus Ve08.2h10]